MTFSDPELGGVNATEQLATPGESGVGVSWQLAPNGKLPPFWLVNVTFPAGVTSGGAAASPIDAVHVSEPLAR